MRKIVVSEFVTVDGVMEAPEKWQKYSWGENEGEHNQEEKYKSDELFGAGALLLGRVTYELFAGYWPTATEEGKGADRMNDIPKYVVSTSLKELEWKNSTLINGDVAEEVSKLKRQSGGDILVYGSAALVNALMQHDLVDEYRLMVHPVVVGSGKRLFAEGSDLSVLELVDTKPFPSGNVVLTYQPAKGKKKGK